MSLDDHRHLYLADLHISRLVSRQPPTTLDPHTGQLHVEPGAATGMNMSGRLLKYLGHPEGYGADFPWAKALHSLRWHCRKNHPQHRREDRRYWQGALCWKIVQLTVIRDFTPDEAAQILRLDSPEPVLSRALLFIEETIDHARARAEKRAREDRGLFLLCKCGHGWDHHDTPAAMFSCSSCGCSRYRADVERAA